jgi:hypothetical protein
LENGKTVENSNETTKNGIRQGLEINGKTLAELAEQNVTYTGKTVLGHWDKVTGGYVAKAKEMGASFFEVDPKVWDALSPQERWAANKHFLDVVAAKGDQVDLSVPKYEIRQNTSLAKEIDYLTKEKGYQWLNQRSLIKK